MDVVCGGREEDGEGEGKEREKWTGVVKVA